MLRPSCFDIFTLAPPPPTVNEMSQTFEIVTHKTPQPPVGSA